MFPARVRGFRRLTAAAVVFVLLTASAGAQKPMTADMELPLSADETAQAIGLKPLFERIKSLRAQPSEGHEIELLRVQQQILLQVTSASLQVDAAAGQIEVEIAETRELENYLGGKRDSTVDRLNLINLGISGTTGTAASALGFTTHSNAAAAVGVIGGVAVAALTFAALRASHGRNQELLVSSNMLSQVFAHPADANNVYPPVVVNFMNAIAPNDPDGLTRQDRLIRDWIADGRIDDPKSDKGKDKIDHVTSLPGEKVQQSIADLDDRQAMLYDLQVRLNYIKQDLAILLASVQEDGPVTLHTDSPKN